MFNRSNRMLLLIAGTLLALSTSSLAISSRTYGASNSYRVCQKVSWIFDQISQNVSDPNLTNSFVKFCEHDESGANKETCQYIANYLLPVYNEIRKDDFCVNLHVNNHVQNEKDKPNCAVCVNFITEIKLLLSEPQVDNLVKQKLIAFCTNLPSFDTECESFVNSEFDNIVKWINTFSPSHFCSLIHQCDDNASSSNSPNQVPALLNLREPAKPKPKSTQQLIMKPTYSGSLGLPVAMRCEVCDEVMKWTLKILADNRTEIAIAHAFDSVCATFYKHNSLKQAHCTHLVDQYTVQLINFIVEDIKPDSICHLLDFCPSSSAVQITLSQYTHSDIKPTTGLTLSNRQVKGPSCLLCVELFRYVYKRVNVNHTEAIIEKTLNEACEFLYKVSHSDNKLKSCESFVAANAKVMVQLIKSNAGPTLTCLALGACATPANVKLDVHLIEPAKPKTTLIAPKQSQFGAICQKVMSARLFKRIKSAKSDDEMLIYLSRACEKQETEQDKVDCNVYIYKQQQTLQKALVQAQSPHEVCSLAEQTNSIILPLNQTAGSCDMCKFIVGIFYKDLKENKTEAEIVNFLIRVCERLSPASQKPECKVKVPAYVQELIAIIENSTNPAEACALLGYCGKKNAFASNLMLELSHFLTKASVSQLSSIRQVALKDKSIDASPSPACQQCINFVTPIHNWLANKSCETELLDDVAKLCAKCPAVDQCTQVLQSHIEAYFDAVDKYSDPTLVCHHIGICSQARATSRINNRLVLNRIKPRTVTILAHKQSPKSFSSELCYECQLLTQFAQTVLTNSTIETLLINDVKKELCDPIKSIIERKVCNDFFNKDGPLIIQHLADTVFDSKRVCQQQLHVCPNSESSKFQPPARQEDHHRRRLVGANKCTFGPSYWCQNEQTAAECKVTEYCAKKVWKTNN